MYIASIYVLHRSHSMFNISQNGGCSLTSAATQPPNPMLTGRSIFNTIPILLLLLPLSIPSPTHDSHPSPITTVTISAPSASLSPTFLSPQLFTSTILNTTNHYRTAHNSTPLTYNTTLAAFASRHASSTACTLTHSTSSPYGENLALGCSDVQGCVELWGEERERYNFGRPGFAKETGHFTQLVWKGTREVGCGREWCGEGGRWFLVCVYWPRGNVMGRFGEEVQGRVDSGTGRRRVGLGWLGVFVGVVLVVQGV
ncbi:CAP domain-containing protein [Immersiella caudata]|uniref:CAP domain-containing protein n=1 Tax=Immersiella caudata TaxID=314043 RepID=A0AA39WJQ4_9PEZI|nr:CAP domain-containing protein [Immersiella caudata]